MGRPNKTERNLLLEAAYMKGASIIQIAEAAKLTPQRIQQIIAAGVKAERIPSWLPGYRQDQQRVRFGQAVAAGLIRASNPGRPVFWTDERLTTLAELAAQGLTAKKIAKRFGVTRNAIIGVCYRKKIALRTPSGFQIGEANVAATRRTKNGARIIRKRNVSPEVRAARSERMKAMWAAAKQAQA